MARKQKKYHYIYKTTNLINNKYYIGMHSTDNINDGYLGSGKRLWFSINYHGKENHKFEILEYCKNRKELRRREEEIVNEELLNEELCMNLKTGGDGGLVDDNHYQNFTKAGMDNFNKSKKQREKTLSIKRKDKDWLKMLSERVKEGHKASGFDNITFKGKKHSDESKKKMSESKKGEGKGSNNSQYGSCWITNEIENKKIMRGDVIPEGWRLGRKIK
jgi:hypothetical protein